MPTAYHMVHYRHFETKDDPRVGGSFEQMCRHALGTVDENNVSLWERAEDRLRNESDDQGRQVILNKVVDLKSALFGEMCLLQSNGLQTLLELKTSKVQLSNITLAEIFTLTEKTAPDGSQFIRGLSYWLAIGDHIFFVKTQSMNAALIKEYFDWLLKVRTTTVAMTSETNFQAEFDRTLVGGDVGEITKLRVSGNSSRQFTVMPSDDAAPDRLVATTRSVADRAFVLERAKQFADAILGSSKADALVESLGPQEYLSVNASLSVRGRRTVRSRQKMREIANDLADESDGKVQVEGKDGKVSDSDAILRTRMPFNLAHDGSNLLDFDNVADQLQIVYSRFVHDGKISA